MNAAGLHVVLAHGRESEIAFVDDRKGRTICRMDGVEFLAIQHDRFYVGDIFEAETPQIMARKALFYTFQLAEHEVSLFEIRSLRIEV